MRINWFSPLPPERTDIGNFSANVLRVMGTQAEVRAWTEARQWALHPGTQAEVLRYEPAEINWRRFHQAEFSFYNIGNDGRFHSGILETSRSSKGILVLHDLNLHELILGYCDVRGGRGVYLQLLEDEGGAGAVAMGRELFEGRITLDQLASCYTLRSWVLGNPDGVVIHDAGQAAVIEELVECPVLATPLPFKPLDMLRPKRQREAESLKVGRRPLRLLVFGFLRAPNRRLKEVVGYLGRFPHKDRLELRVLGEVDSEQELLALAAEAGLAGQVQYEGFVPEARLETVLDEADLVINLRNPTRGEASGSQLRLWNHSLPSLVTRDGWYGHLPENCVAFVHPAREEEDVHRCLADMLAEPQRFFDLGLAGWERLRSDHSVETYVDRLLGLTERVAAWRGAAFARDFAHSLGESVLVDLRSHEVCRYLMERSSIEITGWLGDRSPLPFPVHPPASGADQTTRS